MDNVAVVDDLLECKNEELTSVDEKIKDLNKKYTYIIKDIKEFDKNEWKLIKPPPLMLAGTYLEKVAKTLVSKLTNAIKSVYVKYSNLKDENAELTKKLRRETNKVLRFKEEVEDYRDVALFYRGFEEVLSKERLGEFLSCESDIVRKWEQ